MTATRLRYLSDSTTEQLKMSIGENIKRYREGDFVDLMDTGEWSLTLSVECDLAPLAELDPSGTPEAEVKNSKAVWNALKGLTPSLACQEGIWVRLTHVECLEYSRRRWITNGADDEAVIKSVTTHFFAGGLTRRRDDNAISRLWWNAQVADQILPGTDLVALPAILQKADIRQGIVERSLTASRADLAAGIVRIMDQHPWIAAHEDNFRPFMVVLNRRGGGMLFEAMSRDEVDAFMLECARAAGMPDEDAGQPAAMAAPAL
jgi:hypothetical protein